MQRTGRELEIWLACDTFVTRGMKQPEGSTKKLCTLEAALAICPVTDSQTRAGHGGWPGSDHKPCRILASAQPESQRQLGVIPAACSAHSRSFLGRLLFIPSIHCRNRLNPWRASHLARRNPPDSPRSRAGGCRLSSLDVVVAMPCWHKTSGCV